MEERILQVLADVLLVLNVIRLAMSDVARIIQMWKELCAKGNASHLAKDNQEKD